MVWNSKNSAAKAQTTWIFAGLMDIFINFLVYTGASITRVFLYFTERLEQ